MATAVETSSQSQASSPPASLVSASLIGAVYVLASLAVVLYAIPTLWAEYIGPALGMNNILDTALQLTLKIAAIGVLAWFGLSLAGSNPPKGLRGGIFLMVFAAGLMFFITRWIGSSVDGVPGQAFTAIIGLAMLFGAFKLFTSHRGTRWMVGLEEQGWFHTKSYKRVLGQRVRRLTILGILILLGSGIWSIRPQSGVLPENWTVGIPFTQQAGAVEGTPKLFTILAGANYMIPSILIGLTLWLAYRAVNVPTFAEFLIATEAEMNKVSWTSRKRLVQDTIVVLATTILMALFLFVVDIFWGWLLSTNIVGVLPPKATDKQKSNQVQEAKW